MRTSLIEEKLKYMLPTIIYDSKGFCLHRGKLVLFNFDAQKEVDSLKLDDELIEDLNTYLDEKVEQRQENDAIYFSWWVEWLEKYT